MYWKYYTRILEPCECKQICWEELRTIGNTNKASCSSYVTTTQECRVIRALGEDHFTASAAWKTCAGLWTLSALFCFLTRFLLFVLHTKKKKRYQSKEKRREAQKPSHVGHLGRHLLNRNDGLSEIFSLWAFPYVKCRHSFLHKQKKTDVIVTPVYNMQGTLTRRSVTSTWCSKTCSLQKRGPNNKERYKQGIKHTAIL